MTTKSIFEPSAAEIHIKCIFLRYTHFFLAHERDCLKSVSAPDSINLSSKKEISTCRRKIRCLKALAKLVETYNLELFITPRLLKSDSENLPSDSPTLLCNTVRYCL